MNFEEEEIERAMRAVTKAQEKIDEEKRLEGMTSPSPPPQYLFEPRIPWYTGLWWWATSPTAVLDLVKLILFALLVWRLW